LTELGVLFKLTGLRAGLRAPVCGRKVLRRSMRLALLKNRIGET